MTVRMFIAMMALSFSFTFMVCGLNGPRVSYAQNPPPLGCFSTNDFQDFCDDQNGAPCGAYQNNEETGTGLKGIFNATVPCQGQDCPSVENVQRSADNITCCDKDGDGCRVPACGGSDTNDFDSSVNPCCDSDGDTYLSTTCGGNDCNDQNANIHPGQSELCNDGIDNNCDGDIDDQSFIDLCENYLGGFWDSEFCICWTATPIIIDTRGDGFSLTGLRDGVAFDLDVDGTPERVSWTARNSDESFLVLDRNRNGVIDGGNELFGASTPQPHSAFPNGFIALAEFDKRPNGGNRDGLIDSRDSVFNSLRLWRDANHDGVSQRSELSTLVSVGLAAISLDYVESLRTDAYGNIFRYRSMVFDDRGAQLGRWAWDVILLRE